MGIEKHLKLTGVSTVSWKDAIVSTINEASKSLDYITCVKVLEQNAKIDGNKIIEYNVEMDLCFTLDSERRQYGAH